jgi:hypothetical protein
MRHTIETNTKGTSIQTAIDDAKGGLGETTITIGGTKFTPAEFDAIVACVTEHKALIRLLEPKKSEPVPQDILRSRLTPVYNGNEKTPLFYITEIRSESIDLSEVMRKITEDNQQVPSMTLRLPTRQDILRIQQFGAYIDPDKTYWTTEGPYKSGNLPTDEQVVYFCICE